LNHEQLAYFSMDSDFVDEINGWEGSGETVQLVETPFGNGAEFTGGNYITIPANPALMTSALHYTTAFWVMADSQNTGWRGLLGRPGRNQCAWINADNQYIHHRYHSTGGGTNDGAPNTPNGSVDWQEWQQVVIMNDGITAKSYINGELLAEGFVNGSLVADSTDMYIGKSPDTPVAEGYFFGVIDEVKMWNRAMGDQEIRHLYLEESSVLGSGILSGQVTNAESGNSLNGVEIRAGIFSVESTGDGIYELQLPPGFYDVVISLDDYLIQQLEDVEIVSGETSVLDVVYELTGNDDELNIPAALQVSSYPNPFMNRNSRNSDITFLLENVAKECMAKLDIYNLKGQQIKEIDKLIMPGEDKIFWDGLDKQGMLCSSGIYMYLISLEDQELTGKLIILK